MGRDQGRAAAKNQHFIVSQPAPLLSPRRLIFSAGWSLLRLYWTVSTSVKWSLLGGGACSSGYSLYGLDATRTNHPEELSEVSDSMTKMSGQHWIPAQTRYSSKDFQGTENAKKAQFVTCVCSGCKGLPTQLTRHQ